MTIGNPRLGVGLTMAALVMMCAGCLTWVEPRNMRGVTVVNASTETVTVVVLYPEPAGESELVTYRPGESSVENNMLGRVPTLLEKSGGEGSSAT